MRKRQNLLIYVGLSLLAGLFLFPILYTLTNSFLSPVEVEQYYGEGKEALFHIFPDRVSLAAYGQMLVRRPDYLIKFWNSLTMTTVIVLGQVLIALLAGYGFAKFKFPFRNELFFLTIILMMMPYQVTLVANYMMLDRIGLLGHYAAIIIPAVFSPFGVFLMRQTIRSMPDEYLEAAKLDGAGNITILLRIVTPYCKGGIASLVILNFIDNWNMVEQPLIFLEEPYQYPLSVFLAQAVRSDRSLGFACGILAMIPVVLLFAFFEKELVEGIGCVSLK